MASIYWCNICCNSGCERYHTEDIRVDCADYREHQTNADKIRTKTDEQLAAMIVGYAYPDGGYFGPDGTVYADNKMAVDAWVDWLKQPAKEDE